MKNHNIILFIIVISFATIIYFFIFNEEYTIEDSIYSENDSTEVRIVFIDTPIKDSLDLINKSKIIISKIDSSTSEKTKYFLLHFYNRVDLIKMPENVVESLTKKYNNLHEPDEVLRYCQDCFIYSGIRGKRTKKKIYPSNKLIKSSFPVPKKGIVASEVFQNDNN